MALNKEEERILEELLRKKKTEGPKYFPSIKLQAGFCILLRDQDKDKLAEIIDSLEKEKIEFGVYFWNFRGGRPGLYKIKRDWKMAGVMDYRIQ